MCKLLLSDGTYHINYLIINGGKKNIHLPKITRCALIKKLKHHRKNKIARIYLSSLLTGKLGRTDTFGGITIGGETWEQMVIDLNLKVEISDKHIKEGHVPAFAT